MSKHILSALMMGTTMESFGFCSIDDGSELEVFSLADIAGLDATDVQEMRFSNLPAGMYTFKVVTAELGERENKDNKPRIVPTFTIEVVEVKAVKKRLDDEAKAQLVGKQHKEKIYLVPDEGKQKLIESIGRLKAFVWDLGVDDSGSIEDFLARCVDHVFDGQIVERPNPNDKTSPYAQLKLAQRKR